ncbi:MAG TPA: gliding motility-associated C-terminal domain-containing protein [Bacteroidia bacterium]|nr:gliding motility-associated C-terminal domain-containing protein [Bacteroidia bacterium]
MKKEQRLYLLIFLLIQCNFSYSLNINIIESQSFNSGHIMDSNWSTVATTMGHTPVISPQTTLDNNSFFSTTDILIVSSGVINLPANRINTIIQFIQSGKPVYLQSEYLPTYTTNQAFVYILAQLGGTFNWNNLFSGDLAPVNVIGSFATTNNIVIPISYYWYSVSGTGDCRTINFLEKGNEYHGFQYVPTNSLFGTIITCTDQDWIRSSTSPQLMENIITHLITPDQLTNSPLANLGNDTILCQGQTITLNGGSAASYLWSNGSTASSINVSVSGTYWVQASNGPCSATDSITIFINQYPIPNLGNDTTLCQGQTLTLNGGSATSYLWSNGSTDSSINAAASGTYWVQTSNGPCSINDTLSVLISNCEIEIELPNVFTPNNDGVNDNFIPIKYNGITKANLIIYNRWGDILFYTDNLLIGWNGSYKDNNCSDGTYFWIVQYTTMSNESKELKGFLTLIKD